ncbi:MULTISPECIES: hypothetical protein [Nocardioides]|uniref:Peptidoglycan binding domain-containing protein n=1 Tax=Nocardioides vastitatis TaxID=2568655 RepID=A0ABW0ZBI2_9ACTN|nr:hypothetical protein [Nocardioides sp.]THI95991.1 hypothetical protein E7Z54_17860 [Nocardioides sp.]
MSDRSRRRVLVLVTLLSLWAAVGLVSWYTSEAQQERRFRAGVADVPGVEALRHDADAGKDIVELDPAATSADVEEVRRRLVEREDLRGWQFRSGRARLNADHLRDVSSETVTALFLAAGRLEAAGVEMVRVEPLDDGARIRLRVSEGRTWVPAARALVAELRGGGDAWVRPISVLDVAVSRSEATSDIDLSGALDDPAGLEAVLARLEPLSPLLTGFGVEEDGLEVAVDVSTGTQVASAWRRVRRAVGDAPATLVVRVAGGRRPTSYAGAVDGDLARALRLAARTGDAGVTRVARLVVVLPRDHGHQDDARPLLKELRIIGWQGEVQVVMPWGVRRCAREDARAEVIALVTSTASGRASDVDLRPGPGCRLATSAREELEATIRRDWDATREGAR